MFWTWVGYIALFVFGTTYAGIGVINPMICVNFALPATRKLADRGWFEDAAAVRKKYKANVIIWAVINAIVSAIFFSFVPLKFWIAFALGNLWTVLMGGFRTGANDTNINEYISAVLPHLKTESEDDLAEIIAIVKGV